MRTPTGVRVGIDNNSADGGRRAALAEEPVQLASDANVAAGGEHVHEAVLGYHIEQNIGEGREKWRHDRRQHQSRDADRHIEAQSAGRPVAEAVDDIQRGIDFA